MVTVDGRDQHKNKALAKRILCAKLMAKERERGILKRNKDYVKGNFGGLVQ